MQNSILPLIKQIHRPIHSLRDKTLDDFDGLVGFLVDDRFFRRFPMAEDEINLTTAREVVAKAETQATEYVGAQLLDDVGQAVVTSVGTLFAEAQRAQRQSDVVIDDK